jgi:hypothetical protein
MHFDQKFEIYFNEISPPTVFFQVFVSKFQQFKHKFNKNNATITITSKTLFCGLYKHSEVAQKLCNTKRRGNGFSLV